MYVHAQFEQQPPVTYIIPGPLHRATLIAIDARVDTLWKVSNTKSVVPDNEQ